MTNSTIDRMFRGIFRERRIACYDERYPLELLNVL